MFAPYLKEAQTHSENVGSDMEYQNDSVAMIEFNGAVVEGTTLDWPGASAGWLRTTFDILPNEFRA